MGSAIDGNGLYPFIEQLYAYFPLTTSINGSPTNSSTINYAAANLATLLDTNMNSNLGSGGTHIDVALNTLNSTIVNVGNGSSSTNTQPFVFLVTDGAQDPQTKGVPTGGWSGTNHATGPPPPPRPVKPLRTPARRSRTAASLSACCTFPIRRSAR